MGGTQVALVSDMCGHFLIFMNCYRERALNLTKLNFRHKYLL